MDKRRKNQTIPGASGSSKRTNPNKITTLRSSKGVTYVGIDVREVPPRSRSRRERIRSAKREDKGGSSKREKVLFKSRDLFEQEKYRHSGNYSLDLVVS